MTPHDETEPLIAAQALKTHFRLGGGVFEALAGKELPIVRALDGVDLKIDRRRIVGLVGESGCGKSTLGMTLVRMHEPSSGEILFDGENVTHAKGRVLKAYRARSQIIFQDPYSSINPRLTVGKIVEEPLLIHGRGDAAERATQVRKALELVHMPAEDYMDRYPSDLSGGQRQRIAIARALVLEPNFIVADEPVSMLDVSIQASVLELLEELSQRLGLSILYISHDIATVGYICDEVAVMYLGVIVEQAPAGTVLTTPLHPYTQQLVAAIPRMDFDGARQRVELKGEVPSPLNIPKACRFAPRCLYATELCSRIAPELNEGRPGHLVRCHIYTPLADRIDGTYPVAETEPAFGEENRV
ncbi:ABC transporter ATP-binding protein [Devosia sp. A369]